MGTEFLITKNSIRRFAENIDMNYDNKIGEMRSIIKIGDIDLLVILEELVWLRL